MTILGTIGVVIAVLLVIAVLIGFLLVRFTPRPGDSEDWWQ